MPEMVYREGFGSIILTHSPHGTSRYICARKVVLLVFTSGSSLWRKDRFSCLFMGLLYHMTGFYAIISVRCCLYQVLYRNYSLDAILHFCIMLLITFRIVNSVPLGSTNMTNAFFDW